MWTDILVVSITIAIQATQYAIPPAKKINFAP